MVAEDDDAWDPFADPEGEKALRGLADRLTPSEWRTLIAFNSGQKLREVEIDRMVRLGLARRDLSNGQPILTDLARETLRAAPPKQE